MRTLNKRALRAFCAGAALLIFSIFNSQSLLASSGCSYPSSLDAWVDKIAGDFLTIADVNQFRCAIEKLETGPLRPNDGSEAAPAYAFRTSAGAGLYLSAADQLDLVTASASRWRISSAGHLLAVDDATYDIGASGATRPRDFFLSRNAFIGDRLFMGTTQSTGSSAGNVVLGNGQWLRFVNAAGTTSTNFGVSGDSNNHLDLEVPATSNVIKFSFAGTGLAQVETENGGALLEFNAESSADPSAPAANRAKIYTKDNGAGKTQVCALFNSGAAQCFATQP